MPRRVAVLGLAVAWCAFEGWYEPGGLWFWLAAGIVAYGVWDFFLSGAYPARGGWTMTYRVQE